MIRVGEHSDLIAIDAFDCFAGDRALEINDGRLHVWEDESQVVAYITVASFRFHQCPYIEFLCVHEEYRRRGIASALLAQIEAELQGQRLLISTEADNLAMLSLLESRRYKLAGTLEG